LLSRIPLSNDYAQRSRAFFAKVKILVMVSAIDEVFSFFVLGVFIGERRKFTLWNTKT
jgi:hypothetical protein